MKLTLNMDMDNAAFHGDEGDYFPGHEAARLLTVVAASVESGERRGRVVDVNGNTVGAWEIVND